MDRVNYSELRVVKSISDSSFSIVERLDDGNVVKRIKVPLIVYCLQNGISYEDKILYTGAKDVKGIATPLKAVYERDICTGYTAEPVYGYNLIEDAHSPDLSRATNLSRYCDLYCKLEEIVASANKAGIVIPDLCTFQDVIITNDDDIKLLDYDGMQIGKNDISLSFADNLGDYRMYDVLPKFSNGSGSYTTELDKLSLTLLLFRWVFNLDINVRKRPELLSFFSLARFIRIILLNLGIEDEIFFRKVVNNLSDDQPGAFLADDLKRITEKYSMSASSQPGGLILKKLTKK